LPEKFICLAHWNINGVRGKLDDINILINELDPDILAITETKIDDSVPNKLIGIENTKIERRDRSSRGGGVLVYYKHNVTVQRYDDIEQNEIEAIVIRANISSAPTIGIIAVYRPPKQDVESFFQHLETITIKLLSRAKNIVVLGDLNCDWLKPDTKENRLLRDYCRTFSLMNKISAVTRPRSGTSLDVILVLKRSNFGDGILYSSSASDHLPCLLRMQIERRKPTLRTTVSCRSIKKLKVEQYKSMLQGVAWEEVYKTENDGPITADSDLVWHRWRELFTTVVDTVAPLREKKVSYEQPAWLTH
jgi:exonuclease III